MKKIIVGLILLFAAVTQLAAQDTTRMKYWYYPSQNIYYNDITGDYWYYDEPMTKWMDVKQLPVTYKVSDKDTRYAVYYKGPDVWMDNKTHKTKYKSKNNGSKVKKTG